MARINSFRHTNTLTKYGDNDGVSDVSVDARLMAMRNSTYFDFIYIYIRNCASGCYKRLFGRNIWRHELQDTAQASVILTPHSFSFLTLIFSFLTLTHTHLIASFPTLHI